MLPNSYVKKVLHQLFVRNNNLSFYQPINWTSYGIYIFFSSEL